MDDCIVISDDEDVECLEHIINLEPIIIDLTENESIITEQPQPESRFSNGCDGNQIFTNNRTQESYEETNQAYTEETTKAYTGSYTEAFTEESSKQSTHKFNKEFVKESNKESNGESTKKASEESPQEPSKEFTNTATEESYKGSTERPDEQQQNDQVASTAPETPKPTEPPMSDHELMMAQKILGNEKYKHNLFDDAIRIYKRANMLAKQLGNDEMSAILHFNLAMTYYKLGSYDQAIDECANAVRINDRYMKAHLKRAEIFQRQCKFEEAVICYEHICELDSINQDYAILLRQARDRAKSTKKICYYKLLGLDSNFTKEDLRRAYRQKALSHHPDRHSDADIVTRKIEEKRFKEASEAHTFISNMITRDRRR